MHIFSVAQHPVRLDCLVDALHHEGTDGIWGGFTARERSKLRQHAARLREVHEKDMHEVDEAGGRRVPLRYRPAVVYRLHTLGWDSGRIAGALHLPLQAVLDAKRTAERAVFYAQAQKLAERTRTAA
ncbi:WhiB family transcriptional regulator [Streptomyces sp. NBC_01233]|uniref:WhiB family transcriptional regulator n=1 Tax=Streptomyces sp. NBC_01233 TaxID=2903787 RepID=UPI002E1259DC|nr:WhiB family transcriptional regulator [Streptomyces sp. NBC_01233]